MFLTLVRHGEAGQPPAQLGDAGRCLTPLGRRQARATGAALAEQGVRPSHVWSSPLVRAVQTAELIVAALDHDGPVTISPDLYPSSEPDNLAGELTALADDADVLLVGHQPFMSAAASGLLGVAVRSFGTAHAYRIRVTSLLPHRAELDWRWMG